MNTYKDLEDSLYNWVEVMFPDWIVKFAYDNGPELQTPYLVIDVRKLDPVGREYNSSDTFVDENDKSYVTTRQDYQALVRFEFVGKYDVNTQLAEMAHQLEFNLRTQRGYENQHRNRLSLMKYMPVRRLAVPRETDTYMYYQLDVTFGYAISQVEEQDWIEIIGIDGIYHDAGREPDHVINTHITIADNINPNP